MRFRSLFSIIMTGLLVVLVGRMNWNDDTRKGGGSTEEINREDVSRRKTVLLERENWVEFQVPSHAANIRLMTNAALNSPDTPRMTYSDPRIGHRYSLQYELLDSERNVIESSEYHFRSRARQFTDQQTGKTIVPLFFGPSDLVSTQTRVMQLALDQSHTPVSILRVKVLDRDDSIHEIVARVTSRAERKDYQKRNTWNRMTQTRREKICQFCVYNYRLLSEPERTNLMRWQWTTAPTIGECESRSLYFVGDIDDEQLDWEAFPAGKLAMARTQANFPIPEGPGSVRFKFLPIEEQQSGTAEITWQEPGINLPNSPLAHPLDSPTDFQLKVDGGIVQICPDTDIVIQAFWQADDAAYGIGNGLEEVEITPDPILLNTFLADHREVTYAISHFENQPTPMRVSVRRVFDDNYFDTPRALLANQNELSDNDAFEWEIVNDADQVIQGGRVKISDLQSSYDHLWVDGRPLPVSDPDNYYFLIPPTAKQVRLRSLNRPLLFSGSVRPANLKKVTQVPEDYLPFKTSDSINKAWFPLRPLNQPQLVRTNRSFFVRSQTQVSEVNEQIAAGNYFWNRFEPAGNWIGRRMLVPVDNDQVVREEANGITYCEIPTGRTTRVQPVPLGLNDSPRLIFVGDQALGSLQVLIDGQVALSKTILSSRGEIELPKTAIENAEHLLVRTDNPAQIFINGLQSENVKRFFKRTAQRIDAGVLQFPYEKVSPVELLSMKVFRDGSLNERCKIKVTIEPEFSLQGTNGPSTSWTVRNRIYDLRPSEDDSSILIDADGQVDQGHRCFIQLNDDLPPGAYTIRVQSLDQNNGYALLYQTIPQVQPEPQTVSLENKVDPFILPVDVTTKDSVETPPNIFPQEPADELDDQLRVILKAARDTTTIETPTAKQLTEIEALFRKTLQTDCPSESLIRGWYDQGWQLDWLAENQTAIISESPGNKKGRGVYAIRVGTESTIAVQAPHRFYDEKTGTIARKLFSEGNLKAACWNSAHRKRLDVAHQERHYFNAFMNALAADDPNNLFVQLHGFANDTRRTVANEADIIISDATQFPSRHARLAATELKAQFGKNEVKLYPLEVKTLGGTQNAQASLLRSSYQNAFLHLEMGAEFRSTLSNSASKRAKFLASILESWADSQY